MPTTLEITAGPITTVTFNRPDVRNAFDDVMVAELAAWAEAAHQDQAIRVVVLRGNGPAFCAGADLRWMARMADYSLDENLDDARRAARMLHALATMPVPVIARIHGGAIGGGAGVAAISDVAIAADDAVFGFTETTVGLVPAMIAPYVVQKIGVSNARAVCLSGVRFSAATAREMGLVHEVVPAGDLDACVERHVAALLRAAPSAIAATKRLIADIAGHAPGDVLALTADVIARQRVSPEGQEGLRAFLEKRRAAFVVAGSDTDTRPSR